MGLSTEEIARGRSLLAAALPRAADDRPKVVADEPRPIDTSYRFAEYVKKIVDTAPPLTPAQRDRIAALLRPKRGAA